MKIDVQKLEQNKMQFEVTVDEAAVARALDGAYKKVVAKVNMPGFRRGKVPRPILEARYGVEVLYEEAIDILLPEAYAQALEESKVEPIDRPKIDVVTFAKGEEAKFKFIVELPPEVIVGEYKGIEIVKPQAEVADEQVEQELKKLQKRHTRLIESPDNVVQCGDTAIIDYVGSVDGIEFSGGRAKGHNLEIGSGTFIPGFEEQVTGMERGQERDIEVKFPEDYRATELAGKTAVFHITLHDIKSKELPNLDDEFAKEISEHESLESLTQEIRDRLLIAAESSVKTKLENDVVAKVVENFAVDVPNLYAEREIDSMVEDMRYNIERSGMKLEQYLEFLQKTMGTLREEFTEHARTRVKTRLVIDKIRELENITIDEAELESHLEEMAKPYGQTAQQVRQVLVDRGQLEAVRESAATGKTIDFLVKVSDVKSE